MTLSDPTVAPQMLELPDWYPSGGYQDVEDMVCNYFQLLLPNVFVCTWLPPGHYELSPGEPVGGTKPTLRIWRQPGKFDPEIRQDEALVQTAAITPTRRESWQLNEFVRRLLDDDVVTGFKIPMLDGSKATFTHSEEWLGPQLIPERVIDEKFIPVTHKLRTRERGGLPNFRQIITSLLP